MPRTQEVTGRRDDAAAAGRPGPRAIVWPAGVAAVAAAAVTTTVMAVVGRALGVPIAMDGEPIALPAFATFTVLAGAAGIVLAVVLARRARRPRRTFTVTTVVLTALSLVPDLLIQASTGSRIVLMLAHLAAAAIIVPTLRRQLPPA